MLCDHCGNLWLKLVKAGCDLVAGMTLSFRFLLHLGREGFGQAQPSMRSVCLSPSVSLSLSLSGPCPQRRAFAGSEGRSAGFRILSPTELSGRRGFDVVCQKPLAPFRVRCQQPAKARVSPEHAVSVCTPACMHTLPCSRPRADGVGSSLCFVSHTPLTSSPTQQT